ncbi:OsmC family protein [Caldisphaera lagunensis]|uniref:OsmC family protein n=1 Tax=Caldisphaera lagunensis TaxID=200415 RepID=UPI00066256F6|nr:OsmC family protein [Caldisphaera lagunensis]
MSELPPLPPAKILSKSSEGMIVFISNPEFSIKVGERNDKDRGFPTPLEVFVSSLAACETITFKAIAKNMLNVIPEVSTEIDGNFEWGKGLRSVNILMKVKGLKEEDANIIFEMTKNTCPVYVTVKNSGAEIKEKLIVE